MPEVNPERSDTLLTGAETAMAISVTAEEEPETAISVDYDPYADDGEEIAAVVQEPTLQQLLATYTKLKAIAARVAAQVMVVEGAILSKMMTDNVKDDSNGVYRVKNAPETIIYDAEKLYELHPECFDTTPNGYKLKDGDDEFLKAYRDHFELIPGSRKVRTADVTALLKRGDAIEKELEGIAAYISRSTISKETRKGHKVDLDASAILDDRIQRFLLSS